MALLGARPGPPVVVKLLRVGSLIVALKIVEKLHVVEIVAARSSPTSGTRSSVAKSYGYAKS
jgi:hypothetical protein